MKKTNLWKRVTAVALMIALAMGICPGTPATAKSKHKLVTVTQKSGYVAYGDYEIIFDINGYYYDLSYDVVQNPYIMNQGISQYVHLSLPISTKVKSMSLKSSNRKVLKVVNKKQGKIKALKKGKSKLIIKVVWKNTGKTRKIKTFKMKKSKMKEKYITVKKGKTYSFKFTIPVKVVCKKGSHKYSKWKITKQATCTEYGSKERKCSKCGDVEVKYIETLPHKYSEWKVTKPATCKEEGERSRVCSICKGTEEEEIETIPHKYDATGKCTVCGADRDDEE